MLTLQSDVKIYYVHSFRNASYSHGRMLVSPSGLLPLCWNHTEHLRCICTMSNAKPLIWASYHQQPAFKNLPATAGARTPGSSWSKQGLGLFKVRARPMWFSGRSRSCCNQTACPAEEFFNCHCNSRSRIYGINCKHAALSTQLRAQTAKKAVTFHVHWP